MAKLSKKAAEDRSGQLLYWKWQFLRRNKAYQKDYDWYVSERTATKDDRPEEKVKSIEYARYEIERRWGIAQPVDYKDVEPRRLPQIAPQRVDPPVDAFEKVPGIKYAYDLTVVEPDGSRYKYPQVVEVRLNLDYPKAVLLAEVDKLLKQKYRERAAVDSIKQTRFDIYKEYLSIWDMRQKYPEDTWDKIAKRLKIERAESEPQQIERYLIERYKACDKLIKWGYLEIR